MILYLEHEHSFLFLKLPWNSSCLFIVNQGLSVYLKTIYKAYLISQNPTLRGHLLVRDCFKHSFLSKIFEPLLKQNVSFFLSIFWLGCVFLMLSCISCLYILDINPLLVVLFANIFFHSIVYLFVCLWFPLLYKNFYIWLGLICFFFLLFPLLGRLDLR